MEITDRIWQQLGSARFMIGARDPFSDKDGRALCFRIGRNSKAINRIRITLAVDDTYSLEFLRARRGAQHVVDVVSEVNGVHFDQVLRVISDRTGMATSL